MPPEYWTVAQASAAWGGMDPGDVRRVLALGRVRGAAKFGRDWMIPANAKKPSLAGMPRRNKPKPS